MSGPLTPYYYMISLGQRSSVRAWMNDVPFFSHAGERGLNRNGPIVHLLRGGENVFAIEIDRAPLESQIFFEVNLEGDHDAPAFYFEWPREAKHLPPRERLPFRFEGRFRPPGELFEPAWTRAPAQEVPCAGTWELQEAVRRLHAAVEGRDLDAFASAMALKGAEMARAYPGWAEASMDDMRADMAGFFRTRLRVRPLDLGRLHFVPRADGRLVHVEHLDGGFVIDAISEELGPEGEVSRVSMNPTFTRHDGEWKVIS